jgi:hypothetical protein
MSTVPILTGLLEAEHAAIYAYGVIGAKVSLSSRNRARAAYDEHVQQRNVLIALLQDLGADVPVPAPGYVLDVETATDAKVLAIQVEEDLGRRWHDLMAATTETALRRRAVTGLSGTAARAARWRRLAAITPASTPFPGQT